MTEEYGVWRVLVCAALALTVALLAYRGLESCGPRWVPMAFVLGGCAFVVSFIGAEKVSRPV